MTDSNVSNAKLTIHGSEVSNGELSLIPTFFSTAIVLRSENSDPENPLSKDPFLLSPLSDPYLNIGGYYFIDLSYYNTMTVIKKDGIFKLLFPDFNQETSVSFIFPSEEEMNIFIKFLSKKLTILSDSKRVSYSFHALYPSYYPNDEYYRDRETILRNFITNNINNDDQQRINSKHKILMKKISEGHPLKKYSTIKESDKYTDQNFEKCFEYPLDKFKQYIRTNFIPENKKARVWARLAGIDFSNLKETFYEKYKTVKDQWRLMRYSQFKRSRDFQIQVENLRNNIIKYKPKLVTTVYDDSILQVTFNIAMSISQVYNCFKLHSYEFIHLARMFYKIFVQEVRHNYKDGKDEVLFVIDNDIEVDPELLETLVFWSIIVIYEKGEIKRNLNFIDEQNPSGTTNRLVDIFYLVDPETYHILEHKAENSFWQFSYDISILLSDLLPFCDCSTLWIYALASDNIPLFITCFLIGNILYSHSQNESSSSTPYELFNESCKKHSIWFLSAIAYQILDYIPSILSN